MMSENKGENMEHQLAQEIIAYCANCNKNLAHTITAVENGRVLSVVCGSCKEEHPFNKPIEPEVAPKKREEKTIGKP